MDASAQRYGGGHHLIRHDHHLMVLMKELYARSDPQLSRQAVLEVAVHIALDKGLLNLVDIALMSDLTRVIAKSGGRRTILVSKRPIFSKKRKKEGKNAPSSKT